MKVSRRSFVRGAGWGVASFFAPLQERLVSEARAEGVAPVRLVVVSAGAGLIREDYLPKSGGETSFVLPESLSPLEPFRNELLLMESFHNPFNKDLHGNGWATLSLRPSPPQSSGLGSEQGGAYARPSGVSFDRFIAQQIGKASPVSSINLAMYGRTPGAQLHLSADGADAVYPAECNPVRGYASLFGQGLPGPSKVPDQVAATLATDRSLLDFMKGELGRFTTSLPAAERAKADQILTSIRELEKKLVPIVVGAECKASAPVAAAGADQASVNGAVSSATLEAQVDLAANALICGRTSVAALSFFANTASHRMWTFLGEPANVDEHGIHGHQHMRSNAASAAAMVVKIQKYQFAQIARLWSKLRAVPEGAGTMADNTLLVYVNSGGGTHHRGYTTHPLLFLGNPGRRLKTGRWVKYAANERSMADGFVTAARSLGLNVSSFGAPEVNKGALNEVLI